MKFGDGIRPDADGYLRARTPADAIRRGDKPIRTAPAGRRCNSCDRRLSIYNHDQHCAACEPERWAEH